MCFSSVKQSRVITNDGVAQIGINYFRQSAELKGCINDARNVQSFLKGEPLFCSLAQMGC